MPTTEESIFQIALSLIPQIGVVNARRLISHFENAKSIFLASKNALMKIPHIGPIMAQSIQNSKILKEAEIIYNECQKENTRILFYMDSDFPYRLKQIYDAPLILYWKGSIDLNVEKILAVVGTRNATDYGKRITNSFIQDASASDVIIVSGLAYGIDIAVHQACLHYNVPTVAVLAGGFHWIYPLKHQKYIEKIVAHGGVLSEYPIAQKPDARFFPLRNRIIAGMSDATLVIEAAERGGALITADYANNYHREVFAVPGNLEKMFSEGCNLLIQKHKANIFTGWNNLCEELNWNEGIHKIKRSTELLLNRFSDEESQILTLVNQSGEIPLDEMAWKLQKNIGQLAIILLNLEFKGIIKALPGHRYAIK